ncbi:ABC-type transport auxiliary lipoprotein family protein [Roseibaca sp. V10]|uniref:ABC-type transport auxiliary lipoprotein family protein n=1 Tax=Roseinatronobacter domitianus TaxID=2940293 RepID=A0ABT0LY04_9RHOB|nr:ABC-type transport auxiliary lipoprotein family protein [Roseibaca domitiana]MCL1627298.1 ABC-type transport auxiliary lipoprotein family protein [Roseibaca domitiana]
MKNARLGVVFASLLALGGCGAVSALNKAAIPLDAYELRAPSDMPQAGRSLNRALSIEPPTTSGALDTDRILVKPNPVQSLYLPDGRWASELPAMWQTMALRAFEDTGALSYVGRRPLGAVGDFALISEITDFQAELGDDDTATIRLRLTARLVRESDARVVARRVFSAAVPVEGTETLTLVNGFNVASDEVLAEMVAWGLQGMGLRLPAS